MIEFKPSDQGFKGPALADFWRVFTDLAEWIYDQGR
jgi:hypothetical protein